MPLKSILSTLGIEVEGVSLTREDVVYILESNLGDRAKDFPVTHDASVESRAKRVTNGMILIETNTLSRLLSGGDKTTSGFEIASIPLTYDTLERELPILLNSLASAGEIPTNRASLHVHVGYAHNFTWIKNAFRLGLWLDPLFYLLGGMGGIFRGYINNAIYCRPLSMGVAVASEKETYYRLVDYNRILKVSTIEEFWKCYGIDLENFSSNPNRYVPGRYVGLNLLSTILHGTLEFRYFNLSLNPVWVMSIIRLCQGVTELSIKASPKFINKLPIEHVLKNRTKEDYLITFENLLSAFDLYEIEYNLSPMQRKTIRDIILKSQIPEFNPKVPVTHIKGFLLDSRKLSQFSKLDKICESNFIDIHNVQETDWSLLD